MVVDSLSVTLAGSALTAGINFLFGQATDLLRRRRRSQKDLWSVVEVPAGPAEVLDGDLVGGPVDLAVLDRYTDQLRELRSAVAEVADGLTDPDPSDADLMARVAGLRGLLEVIYGQHITFHGEQRPTTGTPLPADAATTIVNQVTTVTASGPGSVAAGRDITGTLHTGQPSAPEHR